MLLGVAGGCRIDVPTHLWHMMRYHGRLYFCHPPPPVALSHSRLYILILRILLKFISPMSQPSSADIDPSTSPTGQLLEAEDLFTPEQHAELDAPLLQMHSHSGRAIEDPSVAASILHSIIRSGGPEMKAELLSIESCVSLCEGNIQLREALALAASEGSFSRIRRLGEQT